MCPSPQRPPPEHRSLRIYAVDPMVERGGDHHATINVRFEHLEVRDVRLMGRRVEVVDVDTSTSPPTWLTPVNLDDSYIAMQHGLDPSESDPQFHQQMVYAVAMRTLEQFDRALGRTVYFRGQRRLRLAPHAFRGANAFYHRDLRVVLFGYFRASKDTPGLNLPGQTIFTCLSHDIIAHEVTHAIVDRLRPHFDTATNPQVRAFHEAFADIVAVFQRLTFKHVVQQALGESRGRLDASLLLTDIAAQFGQGLGSGGALRTTRASKTTIQDVHEEHDLGAVLVNAVFDGFLKTYEHRTADLVRLATDGSGVLPEGALHPDLVARLASECVRTAQGVLTMCIRAFDYLPPADVDFGAFLRALVTADWELNPLDEGGQRAALIEACRCRGIFASEVGSLAVSALVLDPVHSKEWTNHEATFRGWIDLALRIGAEEQRARSDDDDESLDERTQSTSPVETSLPSMPETLARGPENDVDAAKKLREHISAWFGVLAEGECKQLGMAYGVPLASVSFNPSHRVASDGTIRFGLVVQVVQMHELVLDESTRKIPSGATLVIDVTGRLRFLLRAHDPKKRTEELEVFAQRAKTDALGWKSPLTGSPFGVDFRGMHEDRLR